MKAVIMKAKMCFILFLSLFARSYNENCNIHGDEIP